MSGITGDKARHNRRRRKKLARRQVMRNIRAEKTASQAVSGEKPPAKA